MKLIKQSSKADLINSYFEVEIEGQQIIGKTVDSGIGAHLNNWELQLEYLQKDYPLDIQQKLRGIIQNKEGDLKKLKRSQSVQSSIKYNNQIDNSYNGRRPNAERQQEDKFTNEKSYQQQQSPNKLDEQQKQINNYVNYISNQSQKRNIQRASSARDNRDQRQMVQYKKFPEWNTTQYSTIASQKMRTSLQQYRNVQDTQGHVYLQQQDYKKLGGSVITPRIDTIPQDSRLFNSIPQQTIQQNEQNYSNSQNINSKSQRFDLIKRSQSSSQIKRSQHYSSENKISPFGSTIHQSYYQSSQEPKLVQKPDSNQEERHYQRQSSELTFQGDKYSQMIDYIQNSQNYDQSNKIKSVNNILQIPANTFEVKPVNKSTQQIQENFNQKQQTYMNYNRNHFSTAGFKNKQRLNNQINEEIYPEKYQMMMQYVQKSNQQNRQMYKNIINNSQWKNTTQSPVKLNPTLTKSIGVSYRSDSLQRSRKQIFEDNYAAKHVKNFNAVYDEMFGRSNTEQ